MVFRLLTVAANHLSWSWRQNDNTGVGGWVPEINIWQKGRALEDEGEVLPERAKGDMLRGQDNTVRGETEKDLS